MRKDSQVLFYFFFILLATSLVFSQQQVLDVKKIGYAKIEVENTITVTFTQSAYGVETLNVKSFMPSNTTYQKLIYFNSNTPYKIIDGNEGSMVQYTIKNPGKENTIRSTAIVEIDYRNAVPVPDAHLTSKDIEMLKTDYLGTSHHVKITPEIRSQGVALQKNTTQETLANIVSWVNQYMTYDWAYANRAASTAEIFETRRGVCDEFAHLALALARSINISSRFPIGYAYSGDEWGLHAWVEFYVPGSGWIEADPTYNELGQIDATHIRLAYGADQSELKEEISTWGFRNQPASYTSDYKIKFWETKNFESTQVSIDATTQPLGESTQAVNVTLSSHEDTDVFVPVEIISSQGIGILGNNKTIEWLAPNQTKTLEFILVVPQGKKNFVYTYPVHVMTPYEDIKLLFTRPIEDEGTPGPGIEEITNVFQGNESGDGNASNKIDQILQQKGNVPIPCLGVFAIIALVLFVGAFKKS